MSFVDGVDDEGVEEAVVVVPFGVWLHAGGCECGVHCHDVLLGDVGECGYLPPLGEPSEEACVALLCVGLAVVGANVCPLLDEGEE